MRNLQDLNRVNELENRILYLESIILDLQREINMLKKCVREEDLKKLQKFNIYQNTVDNFLLKRAG